MFIYFHFLNIEKSDKFKNKNKIYDGNHFIQYLQFNILKIDESFSVPIHSIRNNNILLLFNQKCNS